MEKRTENQGRMSDVEIMAIYRKDKKAGNEQMINKYSKYVYDVSTAAIRHSIRKSLKCTSRALSVS